MRRKRRWSLRTLAPLLPTWSGSRSVRRRAAPPRARMGEQPPRGRGVRWFAHVTPPQYPDDTRLPRATERLGLWMPSSSPRYRPVAWTYDAARYIFDEPPLMSTAIPR